MIIPQARIQQQDYDWSLQWAKKWLGISFYDQTSRIGSTKVEHVDRQAVTWKYERGVRGERGPGVGD